ncbi:MAG: ABC transporter ATP-binding protein [Paracoccaceae bacterium]|uniref:ABC transporter ATP-binding protein n=1 Tax=Candidatus Salinivivens marinus TaxID=3381703 RepID=UPI000B6BB678|nr:multidrug ABC transporter ATP-binding protein [Marinovum sp.]OUU11747.1 MAG: multidrug ABC transporter ATP-binding protein [Rhodobacteraceae bacterium TMED38]PDH59775.1 MAG: multidrug ABC transporter ATP-binding protein [Rhodobacteraceae bacterium MED-G08]|tara:strand:- start:1921 stop:2850 length:930 start_codon:yes stop_codon:yes gene_type:complete
MTNMLSITGLSKRYNDGQVALENVSFDVNEGEILALLGPNGAGKTTLISAVCGLVVPTAGQVTVGGFDTRSNYRLARSLIGLVPQEIALEPFEKVINTVRFSRGLFGKSPNDDQIEIVLRQLSLWDKKDSKILQLSGGMKRRVLIAKALAHEPRVLFLDEPSAGVDVELRRDMWKLVSDLKSQGVTIILTTHYIEEAEAIADRVGVISKGKLILLEEKKALMKRMGRKKVEISLQSPIAVIPVKLQNFDLYLSNDGLTINYLYDAKASSNEITKLLNEISISNLQISDLKTSQSSLEEIFVSLIEEPSK